MKKLSIDYAATGFFGNTVVDYLNDAVALRPFYEYPPDRCTVPGIIEHIRGTRRMDREALRSSIRSQYDEAGLTDLSSALKGNIEALAHPMTYTVTTAHQLNLFGGPLYYMLKIANTLRVTRDLQERYPDARFVPVYWMGSEDHDFEEVNHTYLFGKKIEWTNRQGGPMGPYSTEGIPEVIDELKGILREGDHLDEIIGMLTDAYARPTLSEAVRVFLLRLFGRYGLVVVDGSRPELKAPFTDVILDELQHRRSEALVGRQIAELEAAGYKAQAGPREINLFYMEDRLRERIVPDGDDFILADSGRKFSRDELLHLAKTAPEKFSPNVLLRPVHQQMVLPNIAYIGGGSEVAYWLQLSGLFHHYDVHFPMLLARTSAQVLPGHILKKLDKLGFGPGDIFTDTEQLKKDYIAKHQDTDLELTEEQKTLTAFYDRLAAKAAGVDASLEDWVGAEGQKAMKSLENISKRLIKTEKQRNDQSMQQIEKLKDQLFPGGGLQERSENFSTFYLRGGRTWLESLVDDLDPFEKKFTVFC